MNFNILRLGGFGDEDVGEDDGYGQDNDDENHTLTQPALGFPHPFDTSEFHFLGTS